MLIANICMWWGDVFWEKLSMKILFKKRGDYPKT